MYLRQWFIAFRHYFSMSRLQPIIRHHVGQINDIDRCTDNEFRQRKRLNYAAYTELFWPVEPDITPKIPTNNATAPYKLQGCRCLCVSWLRDHYLSNYDIYGVLKASMSRQIESVFAAICSEVVHRLKE